MKKVIIAASLLATSFAAVSAPVVLGTNTENLYFDATIPVYCGITWDKTDADMGFNGVYNQDAAEMEIFYNGSAVRRNLLIFKLDHINVGGFQTTSDQVGFQVTTENEGVHVFNLGGNERIVGDVTGDVEVRATLPLEDIRYRSGHHILRARFELVCPRY